MQRKTGANKLLASTGGEAAAKANLETLEAIRAYIAEAVKYNDFSLEHLNRHLLREVTKTKKAIDKAGKEVLSAKITQAIEDEAQKYGARDASLVAEWIERENVVRAGDIDKAGNITGIVIESRDGIRGESLKEHIKRLRIAADTSMLFSADEPSQNKTKPLVNPWKKESFNLTLQGQILTQNPELATRMKAEAIG